MVWLELPRVRQPKRRPMCLSLNSGPVAVEKINRRRVRWGRVVLLFVQAIVLTFLGRFLQDQLSSMVPDHEAILRRGVGAIYVVLLVVFIAAPLLEEFGVKVDRSRSKRTK